MAWQYHVFDDIAYTISYAGEHYNVGSLGQVKLFFNKSDDGRTWTPISSKTSPFSLGGISEVGWAVDNTGVLYGVGRNEDGDDSGWGSRVLKFDPETMEAPQWIGNQSNPNIYESPRMFTHEAQCSKIGKKCHFKSAKKTLFALSKMAKKSIFKTNKNVIFGLFSGAKIDFLPFL